MSKSILKYLVAKLDGTSAIGDCVSMSVLRCLSLCAAV